MGPLCPVHCLHSLWVRHRVTKFTGWTHTFGRQLKSMLWLSSAFPAWSSFEEVAYSLSLGASPVSQEKQICSLCMLPPSNCDVHTGHTLSLTTCTFCFHVGSFETWSLSTFQSLLCNVGITASMLRFIRHVCITSLTAAPLTPAHLS